ncbi:MAG TPA: Gfo/Idh/MocA family oxidoreductase [Verrucomicrobiae bacterium]|nr:Gfo/Idh/MocA family oxidoreductase [Verrucomicrobiae bacterium]
MKSVRLGVIGLGNIGRRYTDDVLTGKIARCQLTALCTRSAEKLASYSLARQFTRSEDLIRSRSVDAVLIATPHYSHTTIGIDALQNDLHVLVEKPISVHKADCERLLAAHKNPRLVFAAMFNKRTDPAYLKLREMIQNGELGEIRRINWIITDWFRSEAYYASGGWRATWDGEGGGVLLNQCLHNLDLFQWLFGMPQRVRGFCGLGRYHNIEVEDDVTAYCEYVNGATAVLISSTGEAPGTNRLEIAAENGRLVLENNELVFAKNDIPMSEFSRTTDKQFSAPSTTEFRLAFPDRGGQHVAVLQNFIDAILDGQPLIAPAAEGIHSVELANAIVFSSAHNQTVELPLDAVAYEQFLKNCVANSRHHKKATPFQPGSAADFTNSFGR